jgi:hypothetical protein
MNYLRIFRSSLLWSAIVARHLAKAMRHVGCRKFFLHGEHSSYFEVYTSDLTVSM